MSRGDAGATVRAQAPAPVERKEIVTGTLSITAEDPIDAGHRAASAVASAGGRIDNRTETPETEDMGASSSLTARIPADELDPTDWRVR